MARTNPIITFTPSVLPDFALGSSPAPSFIATTTNTDSSSFIYASNNGSIATINATTGVITPITVGTVIFTVSQLQTANFNVVDKTITLTIKNSNTITLTPTTLAPYTFGSLPVPSFSAISTNTDVGKPGFTYSTSDASIATINASGVITPVKAGSVTFTINQASSTTFSAAQSVQIVLAIGKATNSITLNPTTLANYTFGSLPVPSFSATSTNTDVGKPAITYTTSDASIAIINASGVITPFKTGIVTFNINQATSDNFSAAVQKQISLTIVKAANTITLTPTTLANYTLGSRNLPSFSATSTNIDITVFNYTTSDASIATIGATTGIITPLKVGTVIFRINQSSSDNFLGAEQKQISLTIKKKTRTTQDILAITLAATAAISLYNN